MGRKDKVIKNVSSQMFATLVQSLLGFIIRRTFLDCLGQSLLGLNGLMTSIIGMLSLVELGVGEAINFSLYEPLAKGDHKQVNAIMKLYKKLYISIGGIITALGIVLFPFLHLLVETEVSMSIVYQTYGLFLINNLFSYLFAYNRNIISADQKDYIVINTDTVGQIALNISQLIVLLLTRNYYLHLILQIISTFARNYYISLKAKKLYPYINQKDAQPLTKEYIHNLVNNVKALFITRVAYFCVSGTDNILLSSFVSLSSVAIYNNYVTILNLFNNTFNMIISKARSVIANYMVLNEIENSYMLFKRIFFVNFIITSYTSIGIFVVCNEVICVWLGEGNTWPLLIIGLLVYNNYSRYILQTCEAFRGAAGLYSPRPFVKYVSLLEGIVNLVFSLIFIKILDNPIIGIFLGTSVSTIVSTITVPWIVYHFLFKISLFEFYILYFKYFLVMIITLFISNSIFQMVLVESHLLNVVSGIIVCSMTTLVIYVGLFHQSDEYRYIMNIVKSYLKKGDK